MIFFARATRGLRRLSPGLMARLGVSWKDHLEKCGSLDARSTGPLLYNLPHRSTIMSTAQHNTVWQFSNIRFSWC